MVKRLMKNKFIKLSLVFMILLSTFMIGSSLTKAEDNIPKAIKIVSGERGTQYDVIKPRTFKLSDGSFAYCLDYGKGNPVGSTLYYDGVLDAGYAYIMENGYPRKSITGNADKDYYITQGAVWYYVDLSTGTKQLREDFKTSNTDVAVKARKLANEALAAKQRGYRTPTMNVESAMNIVSTTRDNKYVSSAVKVTGDFATYNVELVSGPKSARIVDVNGNAKNTFNKGENYYVEVLKSEMNKDSKINTKVTTEAKITKAYRYKPENTTIQSVLPIISASTTIKLWSEVNFDMNLGSLEVIKIDDETKEGLAGASLELVNEAGTVIESWISDGKYKRFDGLMPGNYKIREKEAPKGYQKLTNAVSVNVIGKQVQKVAVTNYKNKRGILTVVKRDSKTGEVVKGAKLQLLGPEGNIILTWTTNEYAKKFSNLKYGKYTVVELEAPNGYDKADKKYTVDINSEKEVIVNFLNNKTPEVKETKLIVYKRDLSSNDVLAGAEMKLVDSNYKEVASWTTANAPKEFLNIKPGIYYLSEVKAPNGYELNTVKELIKVEEGKETVVNFYNNKKEDKKEAPKGSVSIGKYDAETNSYLVGAHIIVRNEKGDVVADFVSDGNERTIDNLEPGFYTVEEVSAPAGYERYLDKLDFSVNADSLMHEIKLYNTKQIEVPITAASMNIVPMILGTFMILFGTIGIYQERKNEA